MQKMLHLPLYYCMARNTLPWDEYRTDQYFTCRVEDAVTVGTYTMSDVAEKRKRMQVELTKPMNCQWEKRETVANTKNRGKWMQEEKATGLKWNETLEFTIQPKYQRVTSAKLVTGLPILRGLVFFRALKDTSRKITRIGALTCRGHLNEPKRNTNEIKVAEKLTTP